MYKTIWLITDDTWYLEGEPHFYTIEMVWNTKLINKPSIFLNCLFNHYIIK